MADLYYVGSNGGLFNSAASWSFTPGGAGGAKVPAATDNCFISGPNNVSVAAAGTCLNLDTTGWTGGFSGSGNLTVSGSITFGAEMTPVPAALATIIMNGTGPVTLDSKGKVLSQIQINGAGIEVTALSPVVTSAAFSVIQGLYIANDQDHTIGNITLNNGTATRELRMGAGLWTIGTAQSTTQINLGPFTGLTIDVSQARFRTPAFLTNSTVFWTLTLNAGYAIPSVEVQDMSGGLGVSTVRLYGVGNFGDVTVGSGGHSLEFGTAVGSPPTLKSLTMDDTGHVLRGWVHLQEHANVEKQAAQGMNVLTNTLTIDNGINAGGNNAGVLFTQSGGGGEAAMTAHATFVQ